MESYTFCNEILFGIFILWAIGSVFALSTRAELGLPFFGSMISGLSAILVVLILDIICPLTFLYSLWYRKSWGVNFAYGYISIFLLNSLFAMSMYSGILGFFPIFIPFAINIVFIAVIYLHKSYLSY